jgi:predicted enzyme related to lactoylglutathione lyase
VTFTPAAETPIGTVVVFRDPDNIQLELWLPAG